MESEITNKIYCLVTHRTGRYWITKERRDNILTVINSNSPSRMLEIDDNHIAIIDIAGIVKGDQIIQLDRIKKGDYQCRYGFWHDRNGTCGHNMLSKEELERYRRSDR